jgi:hypothetical protein
MGCKEALPPAPPGWELGGTAPGGKRTMKYTRTNRQGQQCPYERRFSSVPYSHHCEFRSVKAPELSQPQIERWGSLPPEQRAQAEVASMTVFMDARLAIIEDAIFHRLLNAFVELGREDHQFHFGSGGCTLSRYRTRQAIIEELDQLTCRILAEVAKRPCASLTSDAGTIERRHLLDVMILAPSSRLRQFLSNSLENERLTAEDYGSLVAETIEQHKPLAVKVRSIVGDNLPVQVSALAHWGTKSQLQGQNGFLKGVKYSPCLCHFMHLVVSDCIANVSIVREFETRLQDLIAMANLPEVCNLLRGRCPN